MKKCCFIIPYFGKLPNYFQLFLKSCEYNPTFNWIVFTDDKTDFHYPDNVKRVEISFQELRDLVQSKFDFPISLERPYKLCDYKPAYGYIFSDFISGYKMWGHCDIDTLMGHLEDFLTPQILSLYDKLFCLGHMTIYKNTDENNTFFMKEYKGRLVYKEALQTEDIYVFDEENKGEVNINKMFLDLGKKVLVDDWSMNVITSIHKFVRTKYTGVKTETARYGFHKEAIKDALYIFDNSGIHRYYYEGNEFVKENFLYIHLQGRKTEIDSTTANMNRIIITPNKFYPLMIDSVSSCNFNYIRRNGPLKHYIKTLRVYKYVINKLKIIWKR